jgi:hypothetical protein
MIRTLATLLAITLLAALAWAASASAAAETPCGNIPGAASAPQDVRVTGVDCATGKRLARRHAARTGATKKCDLRKASCSLDGWRCRRTFFGNAGTRVRCTQGPATVRFFYGA